MGEDPDYDKVIARYRLEKLGDDRSENMKIVPVNFNSEHKTMLVHCKMIFEMDGGAIDINPDRFDKLITALRTAVDNDGVLDKEATSYNDIFDGLQKEHSKGPIFKALGELQKEGTVKDKRTNRRSHRYFVDTDNPSILVPLQLEKIVKSFRDWLDISEAKWQDVQNLEYKTFVKA